MKQVAVVLLAACALSASPTGAVELGADHAPGEVLLFPYFTARDSVAEDFATLLTLSAVGTGTEAATADAVAVRVALRSQAADGAAVPPLLINVLLRANDSWTLAATQGAVFSLDGSCALTGAGSLSALRSGVPLAANQGWVEVFELGRISAQAVIDRLDRPDRAQACAELAAMLPQLAVSDWLQPPDNRLRGTGHLVSVITGTSFTVKPTVLRNFRDQPAHAPATEDSPTLADAAPATAEVLLPGGTRRLSSFGSRGIDAVTAVLMNTAWDLDYEISAALGARTDVVVTLPTRRWYVAGDQADAPFRHPDRAAGAFELHAQVFDREGASHGSASHKCTPPFAVPALGPLIDRDLVTLRLGEASTFHDPDARPLTFPVADSLGCAIGGLVPATLPEEGFQTGRVTLQFVDGPRAPAPDSGFGRLVSEEGHVFLGLPVVGFAASSVENANVRPGVLAHYGVDQPIIRRTAQVQQP